jgi:hypothetical protein
MDKSLGVFDEIVTICLKIMNFSITWFPSKLNIFFTRRSEEPSEPIWLFPLQWQKKLWNEIINKKHFITHLNVTI